MAPNILQTIMRPLSSSIFFHQPTRRHWIIAIIGILFLFTPFHLTMAQDGSVNALESVDNQRNDILIYDTNFDGSGELFFIRNEQLSRTDGDTTWTSQTDHVNVVIDFIISYPKPSLILIGRKPTPSTSQLVLIQTSTGEVFWESELLNNDFGLIETTDIDHDGQRDILWAPSLSQEIYGYTIGPNSVSSLFLTRLSRFRTPESSWMSLALGDLNGDSRDEIMISGDSSSDFAIVLDYQGTLLASIPRQKKSHSDALNESYVSLIFSASLTGPRLTIFEKIFGDPGIISVMSSYTFQEEKLVLQWQKDIGNTKRIQQRFFIANIVNERVPEIIIQTLNADLDAKNYIIYDLSSGRPIYQGLGTVINYGDWNKNLHDELVILDSTKNLQVVEFSSTSNELLKESSRNLIPGDRLLTSNTFFIPTGIHLNNKPIAAVTLPFESQKEYFSYFLVREGQDIFLKTVTSPTGTQITHSASGLFGLLENLAKFFFKKIDTQEPLLSTENDVTLLYYSADHTLWWDRLTFWFRTDANKLLKVEKGFFSRRTTLIEEKIIE